MSAQPYAFQIKDFSNPPAPANRVIALTHLMPGNDGGYPIWEYLTATYTVIGSGDRQWHFHPRLDLMRTHGRTYVMEVPHGRSVSAQAELFGVPARLVTTPVLVVPSYNALSALDSTGLIESLVERERPVAFALGDVTVADTATRGARSREGLGPTVGGMVSYLESVYNLPVVYIAVGEGFPVIDAERPLQNE